MNCTGARQHWLLYLDGEGDPELHLRIRDHLRECPACAKLFAEQQRLEQEIKHGLSAGDSTPELWTRVLSRVGIPSPGAGRRRWPVWVGVLTAAAALVVVMVGLQVKVRSPSTELTRNAAELHEQWLRGEARPDFVSSSDQDVDRYLKNSVPFRVHCPPRTDVNFQVQGAGVCALDRRQAAYIVGKVGQAPVSILVLDKAVWPKGPDGPLHCREGEYQVVSKVIVGNLVVVIGAASAETLEKLLNAYGSYPEG